MRLRYTVDAIVDPNSIDDGLPERIVRDEIASNLEGQKYAHGCEVQVYIWCLWIGAVVALAALVLKDLAQLGSG